MLSNFTLLDLSIEENEKIKNAKEKYGNVFEHASKLNNLLWNFLQECEPECYPFCSFLSSTQISLTLALLSIIREHDIQAKMIVRNALESAVLACYSLYKPNIANRYQEFKDNPDKQATLHKRVIEKAYKWIEKEFSSHSDTVKFFKDMINSNYAHANIIMAQRGIISYNKEIHLTFFDKPDPLMTIQGIWYVAHVTFGILDLFAKSAASYPAIKPQSNFLPKLKELFHENMEIKRQLEKHPRFTEALNKLRNNG